MVRHILLLAIRPETSPGEIAAIRSAITALPDRIPGLINAFWGVNFAAEERRENFTHGFTMDFESRAALEAYAPHPEHQPVAQRVRAACERILVLDFDLP
ncbi:MAG: Dabb family protein [Fibrobacteria bacterium]|nr:Dabb family protein [Fibrobacteria bacterium]